MFNIPVSKASANAVSASATHGRQHLEVSDLSRLQDQRSELVIVHLLRALEVDFSIGLAASVPTGPSRGGLASR